MPTNLHPYSISLQPTRLMFFTTQNCSFKRIQHLFEFSVYGKWVFSWEFISLKKEARETSRNHLKGNDILLITAVVKTTTANNTKETWCSCSFGEPTLKTIRTSTSLLLTLWQYVQNLPCPDRLWHSSWELYSLIHPCKSTPQGRLLQCVRHSSRTPELWNWYWVRCTCISVC